MANACDKSFASSYMLLKPEELGFFDLIHVLFSPNLEKRTFVDSPEGNLEESFRHRWLMFISILTQKFLQFVATPLAYFGSSLEFWLNLVSSNQNVFMLILNVLRGKAVIPDRASANFSSFIGNLDKRVELDHSLKRQDIKYNAALSVMASKVSYENVAYIETTVKDHWKMECLGFSDFWNDYQGKASTQAFILLDKSEEQDTYVVAFRGTEPFNSDDWCSDFDISWYGIPGLGKIHGGFMKALGLQRNMGWPKEITRDESHPHLAYYAIRGILRERLAANDKAKFILTGHSLGGALAILFTAILLFHDDTFLLERIEGVYTFGQPRVGDETFAEYMEQQLRYHRIPYYRFVYCNDIVTRLPYDDKDLMFKHFGQCVYYDRNYQLKIVKEEPNKNYFSPSATIPMTVNAFWEIIRSFTTVRKNGPDYRESFLLRLFRIIGLFIPGVPPHCPQDYVNATRLGPLLPQLTAHHKHD